MPTGVTSAWGYPINSIGGQLTTMIDGYHPLTYEESLTSYPPTFRDGVLQSPLVNATMVNSFGRTRHVPKKICKLFLRNKGVNPLTGRKIKRFGNTFKRLISECQHHGLLNSKKKTQKKKLEFGKKNKTKVDRIFINNRPKIPQQPREYYREPKINLKK